MSRDNAKATVTSRKYKPPLDEGEMTDKELRGSAPINSRYNDHIDRLSKGHIARLAFLLTSILIALASISLVFTGFVASREANRQTIINNENLLGIALNNKFSLIARDQLSLARWDKSVLKISHNLDQDFVTDEFIDSLWFDFGLDHNWLIGPKNTILAESFKDEVRFNTRELKTTEYLYQLVQLNRNLFFENRASVENDSSKNLISSHYSKQDVVSGFMLLDDQVVMVSAMAIVPDDGVYPLPEGNPVTLLSAMLLKKNLIDDLNNQLSFFDLQFIQQQPNLPKHSLYQVISITGENLGFFTWNSTVPGQQIWHTIIPVIIVLSILLSMVAFAISRKIGNLTISLEASEQHNFHLAMHDTLSGLANRLQFNRAMESATLALTTTPFTLIQCDLDRFKQVNDTFGHAAGDTVIKTVADRLKRVVGSIGLVGRIGGDEFAILLIDYVDHSRLRKLSAQIIAEICLPIEIENGDYAKIGISLGIAFGLNENTSLETIMAAADGALYKAKDMGRNQAVFADE